MTLRHLRIYLEVYRCGSITQAAKKLYISQPSVSQVIQELESHYGLHLFDRISRRMQPTEEGRRFYDYAYHIIALFDELEEGAQHWEASGRLRIGCSVTIGTHFLPGLLLRFRRMYPELTITAQIRNSTQLEELVYQGKLDLALVEGLQSNPHLTHIPLSTDKLVVIAPPGHPLADRDRVEVSELAGQPFVLRETGSAGRDIFDGLMASHGFVVEPLIESISTEAVLVAVASGLGLSVLPEMMVRQALQRGRVCRLQVGELELERQFSLIHHKNKYLTAPAQAFAALCQAMFARRALPAHADETEDKREK